MRDSYARKRATPVKLHGRNHNQQGTRMQTLNEQDFLARRREAAAITCVLDIDDSGYGGARFYPADLVAF